MANTQRKFLPLWVRPFPEWRFSQPFGFAMITVLWAYEGWQFGTYSAGEVENPQKSFPRAFLAGSLLLAGLYLFAVIAYLVALGPRAATASDTIAAAAATSALGPWAGMLRIAEVHPRFGTPAAAVFVLGVWSCILALAGGFEKLANGAILIGWIFYGLGAAVIFPIRAANRGKAIPYRVPGYPVTPLLFVLAALAIVGNAVYGAMVDPRQFTYLLVAIAIMLLGLPGYYFWSRHPANR